MTAATHDRPHTRGYIWTGGCLRFWSWSAPITLDQAHQLFLLANERETTTTTHKN